MSNLKTQKNYLSEGAEAKIEIIDDNTLKKIRLPKKYRIEIIDKKLRKSRNKREFKILNNLYEKKINVPKPFELNETKQELSFTFEYIHASPLKQTIDAQKLELAFKQIMMMHNQNIIHGDLTTLNMLDDNGKIYIIDFGLGEFSAKIEDKAVDLHLFFNCIKNEHPQLYKHKKDLEQTYINEQPFAEKIIHRLKQIEKRGRNK